MVARIHRFTVKLSRYNRKFYDNNFFSPAQFCNNVPVIALKSTLIFKTFNAISIVIFCRLDFFSFIALSPYFFLIYIHLSNTLYHSCFIALIGVKRLKNREQMSRIIFWEYKRNAIELKMSQVKWRIFQKNNIVWKWGKAIVTNRIKQTKIAKYDSSLWSK